jgi:hypothetical protein
MKRWFLCFSWTLLALPTLLCSWGPVSAQAVQDIVARGELKIGYIPAPPGDN